MCDDPQRSCDRKINEFVKRVRAAKIHMLLVRPAAFHAGCIPCMYRSKCRARTCSIHALQPDCSTARHVPLQFAIECINAAVDSRKALRHHAASILTGAPPHAPQIGHLRNKLPTMFGKDKAQKKLLEELPQNFHAVMREHHLPIGDFPDPARFADILSAFDLSVSRQLHIVIRVRTCCGAACSFC